MTAPLLPALPGYDNPQLIAHGTTALVFRAIQTNLNRPVAIKVITVDTGSVPVNAARELATTVALSSQPHIVSIIDTGTTEDDRPYIVMEYCEGGSYAQILRHQGPLPVDAVIEVGVKIGEALHAAHQAGIVHRDVKPSNILRSRFGPALTDFGIARAPDELGSTLTREMMTPHHASPEALLHQAQSGPSDIYSLASTLWTLLVGHPPFVDPLQPVADMYLFRDRVLHDPLPAMSRADVPAWLVGELTKAMSKLPAHRHSTALEFAEALRRGSLGLSPSPATAIGSARVHVPGVPAQAWPSADPPASAEPAPTADPVPTFVPPPARTPPPERAPDPVAPMAEAQFPPAAPDAVLPPNPTQAPASRPWSAPPAVASGDPLFPPAPAEPPREEPLAWFDDPAVTRPSGPRPGLDLAPRPEPDLTPTRPPADPTARPGLASSRPDLPPSRPDLASSRPELASPRPDLSSRSDLAPARPGTVPPPPAHPVSVPPALARPVSVPPAPAHPAAPTPEPVLDRHPLTRAPLSVPIPDEGGWLGAPEPESYAGTRHFGERDLVATTGGRRGGLVAVLIGVAVIAVASAALLVLKPGDDGNQALTPTPSASTTLITGQTPGMPTDVKIAEDRGTSVTLTWTDPTAGQVSFVIVQKGSTGEPFKTQTTAPGTRTVTFAGLDQAKNYCFTVGAVYTVSNVALAPDVCTRR